MTAANYPLYGLMTLVIFCAVFLPFNVFSKFIFRLSCSVPTQTNCSRTNVDWLTKSLSTPVLQDLNDIQHNQHAILDIFATSVVLISISIHSGDDPKLVTPTLVYRPVLSADFYSRILSLYIKQMMSAQAIYIYTLRQILSL